MIQMKIYARYISLLVNCQECSTDEVYDMIKNFVLANQLDNSKPFKISLVNLCIDEPRLEELKDDLQSFIGKC